MARPKGSRDLKPRRTAARKVAVAAAAKGMAPLDLMLLIMHRRWERDDEPGALQAAEKVAPYVHSKLTASTIQGDKENPLVVETSVINDGRTPISDYLVDCILEDAQKSGDPVRYLREYRQCQQRRDELMEQVRAKRPAADHPSIEAFVAEWSEVNALAEAEQRGAAGGAPQTARAQP